MSCDDTVGIVEDTTASSVRYRSVPPPYNEGLSESRWCGRYWVGRPQAIGPPTEGWNVEAFLIGVNGRPIRDGWTVIDSSTEDSAPDAAGKHHVVTLANEAEELVVEVHTELDGTSSVARWIVVTNLGARTAGRYQLEAALWSTVGGPQLHARVLHRDTAVDRRMVRVAAAVTGTCPSSGRERAGPQCAVLRLAQTRCVVNTSWATSPGRRIG